MGRIAVLAGLHWAEQRALDHQLKLRRWASADPGRRFGDVSTWSMTGSPFLGIVFSKASRESEQ
jgi:hypothetical protein